MLLKWLDAREATDVGTALADDFVLRNESGSSAMRPRDTAPGTQGKELQKFLQKFLQRIDREARPLKLNVFKRAKLANSFKWRLLEKGVDKRIVDELTQALVTRLTVGQVSPARSDATDATSNGRSGRREVGSLLTQGDQYLARGAYTEAIESYQKLLGLDPRNAVARNGLGVAFLRLSRYDEAEQEFRRAIGIRPGFPEAHFNLGGLLRSTGRYTDSEMPLRRALKLKPAYVEARISLGMTLMLLGRLQDAKDCFEKGLRSAPRDVQALVSLGQLEALNGCFDAAETAYRRALEVEPNSADAWAARVWVRRMTPADAPWLRRAEEIAESGVTPVEESALRFAIGKYHDDVGDFPTAFRSYRRANELHRMRGRPYDRVSHSRFVDDLVKVYTPEALRSSGAGASDSARPVFVIGMPRSGTSLVEQIIASHPAAHGAGELDFWTGVVLKHESTLRQALPTENLRRKLAVDYARVLAGRSKESIRIVDKATANADYLGLIHSVFPNARIIYLRRDPIDACLSCYFQQFSPVLNFTTDLSDLVHYYREHHRLMTHWRSVLPTGTSLDVPYAELTQYQEKWTRTILGFVGLPWDERCLRFHETTRPVGTASSWQVRQKIYKSSVGRWRNYEKFLGPLLELKGLT